MHQAIVFAGRADALKDLSADQRKRLVAFARFCAVNTGEEGEDLLSMAHVRWMKSSEPVQGPEQTFSYLCGAIRNLRFNLFRRQKGLRKTQGIRVYPEAPDDPDPVDLAPDPGVSQEDTVFAQQLYDLCASDDEIQTMLLYNFEQKEKSEIQEETGWDDKKYETVRKRKIRMIARLKIEGRLG